MLFSIAIIRIRVSDFSEAVICFADYPVNKEPEEKTPEEREPESAQRLLACDGADDPESQKMQYDTAFRYVKIVHGSPARSLTRPTGRK